uniref:Uncharacterized protein n=1 Tax=viral metagenome TaxID=1070528 RepID=A0A6M3IKR5_9ZZZZ
MIFVMLEMTELGNKKYRLSLMDKKHNDTLDCEEIAFEGSKKNIFSFLKEWVQLFKNDLFEYGVL